MCVRSGQLPPASILPYSPHLPSPHPCHNTCPPHVGRRIHLGRRHELIDEKTAVLGAYSACYQQLRNQTMRSMETAPVVVELVHAVCDHVRPLLPTNECRAGDACLHSPVGCRVHSLPRAPFRLRLHSPRVSPHGCAQYTTATRTRSFASVVTKGAAISPICIRIRCQHTRASSSAWRTTRASSASPWAWSPTFGRVRSSSGRTECREVTPPYRVSQSSRIHSQRSTWLFLFKT